MTTREMIAVMQAYEDGKQIQARFWCKTDHWIDNPVPVWNWGLFEYRIKPEEEEKPERMTTRQLAEWLAKREMIAVMQAYEEGKKIQCKFLHEDDNCWCDCNEPDWDWLSCEYRIKPEEEKPNRMTNRQLAEWLAKGNGEHSYGEGKNVLAFTYWSYDLEEMNLPVEEEFVIRPWGSDDWVEPTVDIYERDCKGN